MGFLHNYYDNIVTSVLFIIYCIKHEIAIIVLLCKYFVNVLLYDNSICFILQLYLLKVTQDCDTFPCCSLRLTCILLQVLYSSIVGSHMDTQQDERRL